MKRLGWFILGVFMVYFWCPLGSNAAILSSDLLQSALYNSDYSNNLFKGSYNPYTESYYICDSSTSVCGISNNIFEIKYNSVNDIYYLCAGNAGYCGISSALYKIKDGYICPGSNSFCSSLSSLGVHPFLIPIESIIALIDGANSATTYYNSTKMSYSNGVYYICNGSVAVCGLTTAFMQIEYDSSSDIYNICDNSNKCYLRLKYDTNSATYNICDSNICGGTLGFMKIKYDKGNSTYFVCEGGGLDCGSISSYLSIKVDGLNYYTCGGGNIGCGAGTASYQTIIDKRNKDTASNNKGSSVIVSEESWNMLSDKYDEARNLIENGNYNDATILLNEILSYEGTIIWGDNYDLARKALAIINEANDNAINSNISTSIQYKEYTSKYSEMKDAIAWMYDNGLTMYKDVDKFLPYNEITREQASKFFVEFAAKVLGKDKGNVYGYDIFSDMKKADPTLWAHIVYANNMGLFKGSNGKFMPLNKLTKAQAIAVLIRIVDGYLDESGTSPYYDKNMVPHYGWYVKYMGNLSYYNLDKRDIAKDVDKLDSENITRGDLGILIYEMAMYLSKSTISS